MKTLFCLRCCLTAAVLAATAPAPADFAATSSEEVSRSLESMSAEAQFSATAPTLAAPEPSAASQAAPRGDRLTTPVVEGQTAMIRIAASSRDHDMLREIIRRLKQQKSRDANYAHVVAALLRETASERFPEDIQDRELPALALTALEQGTDVPVQVQVEILEHLMRDPSPTRLPPEAYAPLRRRKARAMLRAWSQLPKSSASGNSFPGRVLVYLSQAYARPPENDRELEEFFRTYLNDDAATSASAVIQRSRGENRASADE